VDVGLDEYATTPERKAALVAISGEAQKTLQSLDEEEISLESGSLSVSDLPVGEIKELAVQFVRLLGGDVTSSMSSEDVYRVIQRSVERGTATAFLGYTPLAQPRDVFTFPQYQRYIREATRAWWRAREEYLANRPGWGGPASPWSGTVTAGRTLTWTWAAINTGNQTSLVTNTAEFSGMLQMGEDDAVFSVTNFIYLPMVLRNE
jgi:hypothetical protein